MKNIFIMKTKQRVRFCCTSVDICFSDHFIDLFVRQFFTQICHHMSLQNTDKLKFDSKKKTKSNRSSAADINPFPSLSNTRNASRISSSLSVSFIFRAIIVKNSGKSIVPLPISKRTRRQTKKQQQPSISIYHRHRLH